MDFIYSFFDDPTHSLNKICAQLATDIPTIRYVFTRLPLLAMIPLELVFAFSIAFFSSWKLALVMLLIFPIIVANGYFELFQKVLFWMICLRNFFSHTFTGIFYKLTVKDWITLYINININNRKKWNHMFEFLKFICIIKYFIIYLLLAWKENSEH